MRTTRPSNCCTKAAAPCSRFCSDRCAYAAASTTLPLLRVADLDGLGPHGDQAKIAQNNLHPHSAAAFRMTTCNSFGS